MSIRLLKGKASVDVALNGDYFAVFGRGVELVERLPDGFKGRIQLSAALPPRRSDWLLAERFSPRREVSLETAMARWVRYGFLTDAAVSGHRLRIAGQIIDSRRFSVFIRPQDPMANFARFMGKAKRKHRMIGKRLSREVSRPAGLLELTGPSGYAFQIADSLVSLVPRRLSNRVLITQSRWPNGRRGERQYAGVLHFLVGRDGKILVVNRVDAERAAMGVVVSELYPDTQLEAIKAQAVLARGQMLMNVGHRHPDQPFQLCAEHHCQAFHGLGALSDSVAEAVWSTRGEVLFHKGELVPSSYHASCGGHTEAHHEMWGGRMRSALKGVPDGLETADLRIEAHAKKLITEPSTGAWCRKGGRRASTFRWLVRRSSQEIERRLRGHQQIGQLLDIQVKRRGRSGRALAVSYVGTESTYLAKGATHNRSILGGLRSGLWYIKSKTRVGDSPPTHWEIVGGGYGHGVGLCQHGSIGLAKAGRGYRQILRHYFPGAALETLWPSPGP
ncbi:MAG: SpoIID/LytB domain-containing protein [Bradymonadia bacterium]